ncbi:hypothetical protein [Pseudomonas putida]|uniref:Uncharacterized protein n=1 Tax=Pseudomonas putida TaxID=303 RepID=A0A8I1JJZ7_PSEPU|nr:hypothetical protein [Pseudomonas putida]MBI6882925.1 hypothetical protein [Pseudomonas putida]
MNANVDELQSEAIKFAKQIQARYGLPLFSSTYGDLNECVSTVTAGLNRNGTSGPEFKSVREWLLQGLKPFLEFPPTLEALVQLSNLVKAYPITQHTLSLKGAWFRLDTEFSQQYGKMWRGAHAFDMLTKERVWLSKFEEIDATGDEILESMKRITRSTPFRIYPPTIEQFMDAVHAVRCDGAPLVEDAWIMAVSTQAGSDIHPLARKARGMIGIFEINQNAQSSESKFKHIYRQLLIDKDLSVTESESVPAVTYMEKDAVLSIFRED